jgi:protein-disulfide isomerase
MAKKINEYIIPISIVIAGIFISLAIFLSGNTTGNTQGINNTLEAKVSPVEESDHIRGSATPDVYLIEFSDFACYFCGVFHTTAKQLLEDYPSLAWVYRHTPYQPGGMEAAIASECVAELGGNEMFWTFADEAFLEETRLGEEWYRDFAQRNGINEQAFLECQQNTEKHTALISSHVQNAQDLGAEGTPHTIILTKNGEKLEFSGALPIERIRPLLDRAFSSVK